MQSLSDLCKTEKSIYYKTENNHCTQIDSDISLLEKSTQFPQL